MSQFSGAQLAESFCKAVRARLSAGHSVDVDVDVEMSLSFQLGFAYPRVPDCLAITASAEAYIHATRYHLGLLDSTRLP